MSRLRYRGLVTAALLAVVALAVAALAAGSFARGGPNHGNAHGKPAEANASAGAAQYQYGAGGAQYGLHRVAVCHKGHTLRIPQPAVPAHLRHGDRLGTC